MLIHNKNRIVASSLIAAMLTTTAPAMASTTTGSLVINATVLASCTVVGSTIAFGNYSSAEVDQTGNIAVLCTNGTTYNVGLDNGTGTGATTSARQMTGSLGGTLAYGLYRDAVHSNVWGSTIGTNTQTGTGSGVLQNLTVYGAITSGQTPLAGIYADTVTVTLTY